MKEAVTAVVVDDHPLLAKATMELLEGTGEIHVAGMAGTGAQCLELIRHGKPKLVFLDYQLPDMTGTEITKQIKALLPDTHVIIFTGVNYLEFYNALVDSGVSGILSKESSERTILNMVHCVLNKQTMVPLALFQKLRLEGHDSDGPSLLDKEEALIMRLLLKGATLDEVAEAIHMSKRTVDNYLKRIFEKMGVKTRMAAIQAFLVEKKYAQDRRD